MANLIGQSLGRYHILEQLGEGGMAVVYKAHDTRLERNVAVKVIRTELFGQAVIERILKRFEREAKALAKLQHPNIVGVIDYGEHNGAPYLVLEYLQGGTLKEQMGKLMPWQEAVRLLIPVVQALEYAHEHKIVHRDVKPSNILLTEKSQPMLTDFGIAKILDLDDGQTITNTGIGVGTPEYMSPEQSVGKAVGEGTDVYSIGVILYELLTGRKPYMADTPMEVVLKQATEPLPRPSMLIKDLPDFVETVLLKALAKSPDERYADAGQLAMALSNIQDRESNEVSNTSSIYKKENSKKHLPLQENSARVIRPRQYNKLLNPKLLIILATLIIVTGLITTGYLGIQKQNGVAATQTYEVNATATEDALLAQNTSTALAWQNQTTSTAQAKNDSVTTTALAKEIMVTATAQSCMSHVPLPIDLSWDRVFCDSFFDNQNKWDEGEIEFDYISLNQAVVDGKYVWTINRSKDGWYGSFLDSIYDVSDFFLSVEVQRIEGPIADACYGLFFRAQKDEFYDFQICDDEYYSIFYSPSSSAEKWIPLVNWSGSSKGTIIPSQVNKLSVIAQGTKLDFYINDTFIKSLESDLIDSGLAGLSVTVFGNNTAKFEFDNFILISQ